MINQVTPSQVILLTKLSDGLCHSGTALGAVLGITRSAVWKQLQQLIDFGIPISSTKQGYQLDRPLLLLNREKIASQLQLNEPVNLHVFTSIDSTNRFLKDLPISEEINVCCAEMQTQGRGRFGREWHSPFGENIYCSLRCNYSDDLSKLSGLSLATSLAVLAALRELYALSELKIKWPNDLYWGEKKLCGILIEILAEPHSNAQIIIGIGLNVNSDTKNHPLPDRPWCSLYEITQEYTDRNDVIAALITHVMRYMQQLLHHGLALFINEWEDVDYLMGKTIKVTQAAKILEGTACGINHQGQLILEDASGIRHLLSSGDTTLKTA